MTHSTHALPFVIATAQMPISGNVHENAAHIRRYMRQAAIHNARLVHFPEGALTGYAKNPILSWEEVDWKATQHELESIMELARSLGMWVVLGAAHKLTPPNWPHNSLYIISDSGILVTRYDKRICSYTEVQGYYTAGSEPIIFDVDGFRFGCIICVEINFPQLFTEYTRLGVDCMLVSAYPEAPVFAIKTQALAAIYASWVSLSIPTNRSDMMDSGVYNPNGDLEVSVKGEQGMTIHHMDKTAPELDIALNKAKPWRASIPNSPLHNTRALNDVRSINRTIL
jgi:predicted amidohydrolase